MKKVSQKSKKIKQKKGFGTLNEERVFDGYNAVIYTTTASNGIYQFRYWIAKENRYKRYSLRTKDRAKALQKAQEDFFQLKAKIDRDEKIFSITLGELVKRFLENEKKRVLTKVITAGRLVTITSQLKHLIEYVGGEDVLINTFHKNTFQGYAQFRRLHHKDVREVTLRNEQTTIGKLIRFAKDEGYSQLDRVKFEEIKILDVDTRNAFSDEEYRKLYRVMRLWVREDGEEIEKHNRNFVRDFIFIAANTGMRFGEMRRLKWENVKTVNYKEKGKREIQTGVEITLQKEITKNKMFRKFLADAHKFFERIKSYSKYTKRTDYIFVDNNTGNQLSRKLYYTYWKELMDRCEIDYKKNKLSYYSLRHYYITKRRYSDVSYENLRKMVGATVAYLSKHYDKTDVSKMTDTVRRRARKDAEGYYSLDE